MEPGCDDLAAVRARDQIPGHLLDCEPVEPEVAVERIDDPVPPAPRVGTDVVGLIAVALGEARLVQPVQGLHLAAVRGCQQALHCLLVAHLSVRERSHFARAWRNAGQVQAQASQQDGRGRLRRSFEARGLQPGCDERIDRIPHPPRGPSCRDLRPAGRYERPMRRVSTGFCSRCAGIWPHRSLIDPGRDPLDLFGGEALAVERHHGAF